MINNKVNEFAKAAIKKWGSEAQTIMAIEEMSELTKELTKVFRNGGGNYNEIAGEVADTLITLEGIIEVFGIEEQVKAMIDYKIERTYKRM